MVSSLSKPVYRIFGDHIARDTTELTEKAGFSNVTSTPLFMNLVKLFRLKKHLFPLITTNLVWQKRTALNNRRHA